MLRALGLLLLKWATFVVRAISALLAPHPLSAESLRSSLATAGDYATWLAEAEKLDRLLDNDAWKADPKSPMYDYKLIQHRLSSLSQTRRSGDVSGCIWILRSGLLRNLGGICDPRLYSRSYLGTKNLTSSYIEEVSQTLQFLSAEKLESFFADTKQSFGSTALLLQGSSIGALIAALVCIHTDEELPSIFKDGGIDLQAFTRTGYRGSIRRKVQRFLKHGYLMDVKILEDCVRSNVGDLTFMQAYQRTGRVLNIVVSSKRKNEVPRLLNYLTAPDVLIWSAACASAAVVGLYDTVDLLAKDHTSKNIMHWSPSTIKWSDATFESDSPEMRLSELFNVNHFILSQASPIMAPLVSRNLQESEGLLSTLAVTLLGEIRHRVLQLGQLGLLPRFIMAIFDSKFQGNVTIAPHLEFRDFYQLFSNPTYSSLNYWILKGEQSTWSYLAYIRNRLTIELTLDKISSKMRTESRKH